MDNQTKATEAREEDKELPLFRAEVLNERQDQWLGPILLETRLSPVKILISILALLFLVSMFVLFGNYTRKARVNGWLVPEGGLVRVMAPFAGVVERLDVAEGQRVQKGDPLMLVSAELTNESGAKLGEVVVRSLEGRLDVEVRERQLQQTLASQQMQAVSDRIRNLHNQRESALNEFNITSAQLDLSERILLKNRDLYAKRFITIETLDAAEADYLSKSVAVERLNQAASEFERELSGAIAERAEIPLRRDSALIAIDRRILEIEQELAETKSRSGVVITAPETGIVTSIQVETASAAPQNVPLLTIIPENSELVAHLYGPSRSIGLVSLGDDVFIRYEAFPYQRYGVFSGKVVTLSQSALGPAELPPQLSTISRVNLNGEPLYRIVVKLDESVVRNAGQEIKLQSGLQLEADISLETRPIYRWILDPVFSALKVAEQ